MIIVENGDKYNEGNKQTKITHGVSTWTLVLFRPWCVVPLLQHLRKQEKCLYLYFS